MDERVSHFKNDRRAFLASGATTLAAMGVAAIGTLAAAAHHEKEGDETEKANEKIVNEFCAAWATKDAKKIAENLADDIEFQMIDDAPVVKGKETIIGNFEAFLGQVERAEFEMIRSHVIGNLVINERVDHFDGKDDAPDRKFAVWISIDIPLVSSTPSARSAAIMAASMGTFLSSALT